MDFHTGFLPNQHQINTENAKTLEDFGQLLESGKFSDFTLTVAGKQFAVHKNILSARSAVFAAMFEHDCKEKRQSNVDIVDIELEVFEVLLRYIYSGKIPDLQKYALELLVAADMYQLLSLKCICEQFYSKSLSIETVANTLLLADMHNAAELKLNCKKYISTNAEEIIKTDSWKTMTKARPELAIELFESLAKQSSSKKLSSGFEVQYQKPRMMKAENSFENVQPFTVGNFVVRQPTMLS